MRSTATALLLAACAGFAADPAPAARPQASAPTPPAVVPAPGALKPFAEVVKEAKALPGLFSLWQKEDKVWLEVKPDQIGPLYFFSWNRPNGIGERGIYGGMMGESWLVYLKRVGNTLQLLARNTSFTAKEGTPIAHAVAEGYSDSLLASAPVLSLPHPERKSVLVEANALLFRDIPMAGTDLEFAFRQPYGFDAGNTSFSKVSSTPDQTTFLVNAHFSLAKLVLPPLAMPGAPPVPHLPPPRNLEDVRSLFLGFQYNLSSLPKEPMAPRLADDRVGHFVSTRWDYTTDSATDERIRVIHRWRLEKADPAAALSKPKVPITYWMDKNIPEKYRETVKAGILEWNKAFERIGFKEAIEVRQQPEDADWSTHDASHASIRWFLGVDAGFAIGPSVVDPRTGEILDADIGIGEVFTRGGRREFQEEIPPVQPPASARPDFCSYLAEGRSEAAFSLDLLEGRGAFEPGSPGEEAFIQGYLKDVVMHEVGHTLGLRHNYRASTAYTEAQLADRAFTEAHGIAGSVMDYTPTNIARLGERQADYHMPTLGPYDYWAIEYAYTPLDPAKEPEALASIAARGEKDPVLAYATDEEAGMGPDAMDPEVSRWDLGKDPLAYLTKRMDLSRELLERLQARTFMPGQDYNTLRRTTTVALGRMAVAASNAAKYLGGVVYLRDHAGSPRAPLTPVSGPRQREALKVITGGMFDMNSMKLKPEFLARMTVNQFDRGFGGASSAPDFSLSSRILAMQKGVLGQIMNPMVMRRILDAPEKTSARDVFRLPELFDSLGAAIWEEARRGQDPTATRRGLQKEYLRQLVSLVLRANPATPDDARSLARESLKGLQSRLGAALAKPGLSREGKAHYIECLASIDETFKASVQRMSL
jgi:Met-zincin/Domain of unknown function (DUF5117)